MSIKIINGYKLIEFKGKGTFGTVYKCIKDDSVYAIKIFSSDFIFDEFSKGNDNRITREIEALKIVDSEYVVRYIDDGKYTENNKEYIYVVMDYVAGSNLEKLIKERDFSVSEAISITRGILEGLNAIHRNSIIHRDLKPANIYITSDNDVKILDFGLSKLIDFTSITSTGANIGSPLYMSPEQIKDSKNIDFRSDYYALGVILFEMLSKQNPYGSVSSRPELFYKITSEPPLSIRYYIPTINNSIDNLIIALLEKENYKRPNSIQEINTYLQLEDEVDDVLLNSFEPEFYLRLWNEKKVLTEFYTDGFHINNVIFPINHQDGQKNLLKLIKQEKVNYIIDPATMRLAYDTYSDVKGLTSLPYAPKDLTRLELANFYTQSEKKDYVKKVVDEQIKHNSMNVVAPFHISNNSNATKIKNDTEENWFSLGIKLLAETKSYLKSINYKGKLIGGFCIKTDILTTKSEQEYFLNILSAQQCDKYWIYVDCINNASNTSQLFNYASSLLQLQKSSSKPVIAGRIGEFGLVLLAFGLHGFEAGASRFELFYEDLYKSTSDSYNMYVRYYIPELLRNIAIERKNPAKIIRVLQSTIGTELTCNCPYCKGLEPSALTNEGLTRKHFLYRRNEDIDHIKSLSNKKERVEYMESRIKKAIDYHRKLKPIFRDDDSKYLKNWLKVITMLKERWL